MTPVNPILVVKNNLPDYRAELLNERAKIQIRLRKIDEELKTLDELAKVIGVEMAVPADDDYNDT